MPSPSATKTGHTPTPWRIEDGLILAGTGQVCVVDCDDGYGAVSDDDAAFIVEAANSHDALTIALIAIADFPMTSPSTNLDAANMVEIARQTLVSVGARSEKEPG